ncbi:hypothetical protein MKZ38_002473 [Zalerion maritima]|uniref:Uncharacterized protein n=1 Tax=Zalerion maritima TaxID=339359 RepID=A0AAD5RNV5_9PEZI|nr:hypothetical protein MKZ38_002473 [Zalerion maritima]
MPPGQSRADTTNTPKGTEKTSSTRATRTPPPSASPRAQDGSSYHSEPSSPAFSATSTADGEASPVLPPLPAPRLPDRVQGFLRTPSPNHEERDDSSQYRTASWGSPYPPTDRNLRSPSSSSEQSDGSLIHHLEINTPFLRPAPFARLQSEQGPSSFISAAVLANRARRPAQGLTEDWIRQHTASDFNTESQAWLSDGSEQDQEPSLLSGSELQDEAEIDDWLIQDHDLTTPRANPNKPYHRSAHQPNETLTQAHLLRLTSRMGAEEMHRTGSEPLHGPVAETRNTYDLSSAQPPTSNTPDLPERPRRLASVEFKNGQSNGPSTPIRALRRADSAVTPRLKTKYPWKGKNIMVHLPRDDERGQPCRAPMPLSPTEVKERVDKFSSEGWNTTPFDLGFDVAENSKSRDSWPAPTDIDTERRNHRYQVTLPDLKKWEALEEEMREAKLRALGVTFADDEPSEAAEPSPAISNASRNTSGQYPPLPFSPPVPTGSAGSNHAYNFNQFAMGSSAAHSPNLPLNSPHSFTGQPTVHKHRPGQSIAIPSAEFNSQFQQQSPHVWNPQQMLLHQQLSRNGSPSLAGLASPGSPYENGGFPPPSMPAPGHGRTQSLQYPMLPHQHHLQMSARASPRLQELCEDDEEAEEEIPQQNVNGNDPGLQREIDDAQYHLEQQFKAQLEEDEYSPDRHDKTATDLDHVNSALHSHIRQQSSVQFLEPNLTDDLVIHHPTPHSRGHSLSQKFFADHDETGTSTDEGSVRPKPIETSGFDKSTDTEADDIETNPSNLGTPIDNFGFGKLGHQPSFSTASNPWQDTNNSSVNGDGYSRQASHSSKSSISKLNVEAPEFKFNPSSSTTFNPSQSSFTFGAKSQPTVFKAWAPEFKPTAAKFAPSAPEFTPGAAEFAPELKPSAPEFTPGATEFKPSSLSGHMSQSSTASSTKIKADAPVFSPQQSDFSFSSSGPKFRPDAPAFQPSFSTSIASPSSGNASPANPIFSNIDVSKLEIVKPAKKSMAIPIVQPAPPPKQEQTDGFKEDSDGRLTNDSRPKRMKAHDLGDDSFPRFSPTPDPERDVEQTLEAEAINESALGIEAAEVSEEEDEDQKLEEVTARSNEEDNIPADLTTISSTIMSESADSKAATSPSATSPEQASFNWAAVDLKGTTEAQSFSLALPFGDEEPLSKVEDDSEEEEVERAKKHEKALSATAPPFTPGLFSLDTPTNASLQSEAAASVSQPAVTSDVERTPTAENTTEKTEESEATPTIGVTPTVVEAKPAPALAPNGLAASRFADPGQQKPKGLAASRFAVLKTPIPPPTTESLEPAPEMQDEVQEKEFEREPEIEELKEGALPAVETEALTETPPTQTEQADKGFKELSFEEIDSVMRHLEANPDMGVKRHVEPTKSQQLSPTRNISVADVVHPPPTLLQPLAQPDRLRSDAPSPSSHRIRDEQPILSTELQDPFVECPESAVDSGIHNLNGDATVPPSEWDEDFSDGQQELFEERAPYFDRHLVDLVGNIFEHRLDAMQDNIVKSLGPSIRRERRSMSDERQHSDADDEDDDPIPRRSMSPRRNGRYELIKGAVAEVFNTHAPQPTAVDTSDIMTKLEEMNDRLNQKDFEADSKMAEVQARVEELEERLREERAKTEAEVTFRREAQDNAAEVKRGLEQAEARLQSDIIHKTTHEARVGDLEERLKKYEQLASEELESRRATEEKLAEIQRQLRISSEEEYRLRDLVEEKNQRIKTVSDERDQRQKAVEDSRAKSNMRHSLLEANLTNETKQAKELQTRLSTTEATLRSVQQDAHAWRSEAEISQEKLARQTDDLTHALNEARSLRVLITTLETQSGDSERARDHYANKCMHMEKEVIESNRKVNEESQRLAKSEQNWLARQEILEARLQAEAKTRERIEQELARLESIEKQGVRAINDNERLSHQNSELRSENHKLEQAVSRYRREFEEAREGGLREVQRTRISMQTQLDASNHEVNVVREEYEEQNGKLCAQLEQLRLEVDTSSSRADMLVEAAESAKKRELGELSRKQQDETEDMQARFDRQISILREDSQRSEQNYLERLSLSTSKNDHLQERIAHLAERLEIADAAAKAAAEAAKNASVPSPSSKQALASAPAPVDATHTPAMTDNAEKFSAKAFRETIDSLQNQLEASTRKNEEYAAQKRRFEKQRAEFESVRKNVSDMEDEKQWLNEMLDIREAEMLDLCRAVNAGEVDMDAARDAAIRLEANIQMHLKGIKKARQARSQPRQGLSIAGLREAAPWSSIRDAAPMAAQALSVFGGWSKAGSQAGSTPAKNSPAPSQAGLMTPPASSLRKPSPADGRLDQRNPGPWISARRAEKMPAALDTMPQSSMEDRQPHTPPMMHSSAYDDDAQAAEDFDDAGFFEDEE